MNREKQIEEMAKHCFFFEGGYCCTDIHKSKMCEYESKTCGLYQTLENLHNAGYRKASEVAEEIFAEIENILDRHSISYLKVGQICGEHYYDGVMQFDIAELKKKYTEEGK